MLYCTKSRPKTIFLTFFLLPKQLKNFGYISYFYAFPYFFLKECHNCKIEAFIQNTTAYCSYSQWIIGPQIDFYFAMNNFARRMLFQEHIFPFCEKRLPCSYPGNIAFYEDLLVDQR